MIGSGVTDLCQVTDLKVVAAARAYSAAASQLWSVYGRAMAQAPGDNSWLITVNEGLTVSWITWPVDVVVSGSQRSYETVYQPIRGQQVQFSG